MVWTKTPKPLIDGWTSINPLGRTQYDQADIIYDDPNIFYDGEDMLAWTNVPKATGGTITSIMGGFSQGLLIPLTRASLITIGTDDWVKVPKAN